MSKYTVFALGIHGVLYIRAQNAVDGSEQLAMDAEGEDVVRLCARDLGKKAFFEEVDANPRESLVAMLIRAYLDILLDILRRPVLMQKAVPILQDMDALDVLQPYIASKWVLLLLTVASAL